MPTILWIIYCTQIPWARARSPSLSPPLFPLSLILPIVTVWQLRGFTDIKLIYGYNLTVGIAGWDLRTIEYPRWTNIETIPKRNDNSYTTYVRFSRMFLRSEGYARGSNTFISFLPSSRYAKFLWEMRSFFGATSRSRLVPSLGFEEWRDANVHHCSRTKGKKCGRNPPLLLLVPAAGDRLH